MDDYDLIPLSALQHYLYCPRQCALIHLEQQWAESRHTAEGRLLHQRADAPQAERRRGVRTVTAMPLLALELGLTGKADVVEFHRANGTERPFPVEYKRGRPKSHRADEVQLCAQALCLEAMLGTPVGSGALFYGQTRRRKDVMFDEQLRDLTRHTIAATREMFAAGQTPHARYEPRRCDLCSLIDLCQPRLLGRRNVEAWLQRQLQPDQDD
ncbi:CRISPR-associated protein Cas4 [Luteimonas sp. TWI1416]|uniref:CRISPR-associated protein Cas4 n=1 Tax=unclassified Luteimonas TaxID=2629088 RepID=UPI00320989F8